MIEKLILKGHEVERKLPQNFKDADLYLFQHELKVKLPDVYILSEKNVIIREGCEVLTSLKKPLPAFSGIFNNGSFFSNKLSFFKRKKLSGNYFWVIDNWSHGYFHWVLDALPRLYCLFKEYGGGKLLLPEVYKKEEFINTSLTILNFEPIFYTNSLKVESLTTCTYLAKTGTYNPAIIQLLKEEIVGRLPKTEFSSGMNMYISRAKAKKRKLLNENEVVEMLSRYGFKTVYLEDFSFHEKVLLLKEANNVVSIHGAGLTNCMFMQQQKNVLEFRRRGDRLNNAYFSLCSAAGLNYYYLECDGDNDNTNVANLKVNVDELEFNIKHMLSQKEKLTI